MTNTSRTTVVISGITKDGAAEFFLNPWGSWVELHPGQSAELQIGFRPSATATYSGLLTIQGQLVATTKTGSKLMASKYPRIPLPLGQITLWGQTNRIPQPTTGGTGPQLPPAAKQPPPTDPGGTIQQYWVSTAGSDSDDGSQLHPWATILHASQNLVLGPGGTTVHVAPGTYTISSTFTTMAMGTASQRIRYVSDRQWGANISCATGGSNCWIQRGDYVDIDGFQFTGPNAATAILIGVFPPATGPVGNYNRITNNYFHDIGLSCGTAALELTYLSHDMLFDSNVINNVGQKGGCNGTTSAHGVYVAGYHSVVTNNIISNAAGYGIHAYHNACQNVISNNTVFHNFVGGILLGAHNPGEAFAPCYSGTPGSGDDYNTVNNNLVVHNGYGMGCNMSNAPSPCYPHGASGIIFYNGGGDNNTANNNLLACNYDTSGNQTNNSIQVQGTAAPSESGNLQQSDCTGLMRNYLDDGSGDYHLVSGSPAVGAGTNSQCATSPGISPCEPVSDFDGTSRTPVPDIGAYQF